MNNKDKRIIIVCLVISLLFIMKSPFFIEDAFAYSGSVPIYNEDTATEITPSKIEISTSDFLTYYDWTAGSSTYKVTYFGLFQPLILQEDATVTFFCSGTDVSSGIQEKSQFSLYSTDHIKPVSDNVYELKKGTYYFFICAHNFKEIIQGSSYATRTAYAYISYKYHPEAGSVYRLYGKTRFETSLKVADELKSKLKVEKFDTVILAYGMDSADALGGSYLSCLTQAPILLVNSDEATSKVVQYYINANLKKGGTIYILGGKSVVPDSVTEDLAGFTVKRLGGSNRFETNLLILEESANIKPLDKEVLVCNAMSFADSLSAAATGKPILLVGNSLQNQQKNYLKGLGSGMTFTMIGGTGAVSDAVKSEFDAYGTTDRVKGANRFATSAAVGAKYFEKPDAAVLVYGMSFPDGLCGGVLANIMKGPLLLVTDSYTDYAATLANAWGVHSGSVLGGPKLISDDSARIVFGLDADVEIIVK